MLTSIQGIYHNGKIELIEKPDNVLDNTRVIVTFLESGQIDLRKRGMDQKQVAELRAAFATFAQEWDTPEMDVYNNYDATKARI